MSSHRRPYPAELDSFVRALYLTHTSGQIAELAQQEPWGKDITAERVHAFKVSRGYKTGKTGRPYNGPRLLTDEQEAFVRENCKGNGPLKMANLLNEKYGMDFSRQQIKSWYHNHGINSGTTGHYEKGHVPWSAGKKPEDYLTPEKLERVKATRFKKGNIPVGTFPIGVRSKITGYWMEKVSDVGNRYERWQFVHRMIWEKANGPVPEGCCIIFLDGNTDNLALDNLAMITKDENRAMNWYKLRSENAEITEAGIHLARLHNAIIRRKKDKDKEME